MAVKLRLGQKIKNYEILEAFDPGAFAFAYKARDTSTKRPVFFKLYKSPSPTIRWFSAYVTHQEEIKTRIQSGPAKNQCYEFIEFFIEKRFFHQVFEFVEGMSLKKCIDLLDEDPAAFTWEARVVFAKVMMAGIKALHEAGIVHTDLKPDNVFLIEDKTITVGYRVRIIDLDWSIMTDKPAPWIEDRGYVGTPFFTSPEHHARSGTPAPASDIFTCGIMLGQILGGKHPFRTDSDEQFIKDAAAGKFQPIKTTSDLPKVTDQDFPHIILNACLHPDAAKRPSAIEVLQALNGKVFPFDVAKPAKKPISTESWRCENCGHEGILADTTSCPACNAVRMPLTIILEAKNGQTLSFKVDQTVGSPLLKGFNHPETAFSSTNQFILKKSPKAGVWIIKNDKSAKNSTYVNDAAIPEEGFVLVEGAQVSLKGKALFLTVHLSYE